MTDEDLEQFMSRYASLIQYILQLKDGRLHLKVTKLVDELVQDGMDYNKAIKIAIRKYKHMLENYLDEVIDNENYEESDDFPFFLTNLYNLSGPAKLTGIDGS
jgi:hypothetical protein